VEGATVDHFKDLFDNAPCGYVTLLPNGRVQLANKTFLAWTGHSAEHVADRKFGELLSLGSRIYFETHLGPLLRMQGSVSEFALELSTASGKPLQMIANALELRDTVGQALVTRIVLLKATDRRRYENQLLQARDSARTNLASERESSELREQFIAVLGHDLRNPLASISAGARILGREAKSGKEHQVIAMLETTVVRMAGLIDNVLDFARGRLGGGITLDRNARRPLEPVLHQVIDELRLASPGRSIETQFEIDAPVDCDRRRIGQLVSNLVGNALSHGASNLPVRVRASTKDNFFKLSVSNGGLPIPEAALEKLFEPFFRGEVRASRQGLGLGLHIASQIAKAHGGTLSATSTSNETNFTFEMPLI
jgi:sigma-B regulation protein RsbU (phosphoserine phosphatase)